MKKTKVKILLFLFLSVIGLVAGFFFSGYINLILSGGNINDITALHPAAIMSSLAENERHRLLTLCVELVIVAGIAALLLMSRKETFESETSAIAGSIKTPVAIGQGQHGTARWLKKTERQKAFALYRLGSDEPIFTALLEAGARDIKEVMTYKDDETKKSANATEAGSAAADTETLGAAEAEKDK